MAKLTLYTTCMPISAKVKTDIMHFERILKGKKIDYEEIDLTQTPEKRPQMLEGSGGDKKLLPQLHVNGKFFGYADEVQEMLDFGELEANLAEAGAA